jgi:hypothetical protein
MNLLALRTECRTRLGDLADPPFWTDKWLDERLNEAEREACIRARLIEDSSSKATSLEISTAEKRYALHPSVLDVLSCELESNPGVAIGGWDLTESHIVFADYPQADDVLLMTVIRMPLNPMTDKKDEPEIRAHHHAMLVPWVLSQAYMVHDADTFDPQAAQRNEAEFENYFGQRPTANVQRKHRAKTGHVVRPAHF